MNVRLWFGICAVTAVLVPGAWREVNHSDQAGGAELEEAAQ